MTYGLLIAGFLLILSFFIAWYAITVVSRLKKRKLKKTHVLLWGLGIPLAVGGLAMVIIGLLLK